ncbi:unnamed protein product [Didymodactylos carnosus]|uniref:G-protein coupled receptors family 1 profile domain-containing protein n=1 Tax=Didymodactylos carnosus TaxID=1234261 RepID=A0A815ZCF2_9BILA|nr:unnamed protein product [Didymodactylos carnosus]CAF1580985.1 unnamed protein product [Didymodactylos carnosus]CAF4286925.1 unnamed protein product [Didymodactylos carnosus]CAF4448462.1 unnamed protein product [Didymodactylos carnosus]
MNNTTAAAAVVAAPTDLLNLIYIHIYLYAVSFECIFGMIGNTLNIIIFTRPLLRSNSCAHYFLVASCDNLLTIFLYFIPDLLSKVYGIDATNYSTILCKLRDYSNNLFLDFSSYCLVLAAVDRWCASSRKPKQREFCQVKIARRMIVGLIVLLVLAYLHMPFFHTVDQSLKLCIISDTVYLRFFTIFSTTVFTVMPPVFMATFGVLTIWNVRHSRRTAGFAAATSGSRRGDAVILKLTQVGRGGVTLGGGQTDSTVIGGSNSSSVAVVQQHQQKRRSERQLLKMLLYQILTYFALVCPAAVTFVMSGFLTQPTKIFLFLLELALLPFFLNYCIGFYVYILSASLYRQELVKILKLVKWWQRRRTH